MNDNDPDIELSLRGLSWENNGQPRTLIYNLVVPLVGNNVDMCLFNLDPDALQKTGYTSANSYVALGELKGGIDSAAANLNKDDQVTSISMWLCTL